MRGNDRKRWRRSFACMFIAGIGLAMSGQVKGQYLPVYGGPTYDSSTGNGYDLPNLPVTPGFTAGSGAGVGYSDPVIAGGEEERWQAVRWDASGATELGNLGTETWSQAYAINLAGTAVGWCLNFDESNGPIGRCAVRWDAFGHPTVLGLGTADAISNSGIAVGYDAQAVRWDASGAATHLGDLSNEPGIKSSYGEALAVNNSGTAVGWAEKNGGIEGELGEFPVRWDSSGTIATELGGLGTPNSVGSIYSHALAVNDAGTAVGFSMKFVGGTYKGYRPVRWEANSTTAIELDNLDPGYDGELMGQANAINSAGTIVGYVGSKAARWDSGGTAVTMLGGLADESGVSDSQAYAINDAGIAVGGFSDQLDSNGFQFIDWRAVMWGADGIAIDLNSLIDPASGWVRLSQAYSISSDNWVTGIGTFDPDGAGPLPSYQRMFLIQVPEPGSMTLLGIALVTILSRRRMNS